MSGNACSVCGYQEIDISTIPVGSYIAYSSSNETVTVLATDSGYDSNQTFTTSSYTDGWKVFKNNDGQLDIISAESVGNLILGGTTGYSKIVYTLNKMCNDYVNPVYATSGRSLGYLEGSSLEILSTSNYPLTWTNTYTKGNNGFPYTDGYYAADQSIINTAIDGLYPLRHTNGYVWLASRTLYVDSSNTNFNIRRLYGGSDSNNNVYYSKSDGSAGSWYPENGVRPVISLKSELKIIGGDGTQSNPYILQ